MKTGTEAPDGILPQTGVIHAVTWKPVTAWNRLNTHTRA